MYSEKHPRKTLESYRKYLRNTLKWKELWEVKTSAKATSGLSISPVRAVRTTTGIGLGVGLGLHGRAANRSRRVLPVAAA